MILGRRSKEPMKHRVRVALWPRRSWSRSVGYIKARMLRLRATPHAIAAGFAAGVFASFTPLMGFHFFLAAIIAWLTRGSIIASAFGTFIGNPLTFPLIWGATYTLGESIVGGRSVHVAAVNLHHYLSWSDFSFSAVWPLLKPMLVGGLILGGIGYAMFYFPIRAIVGGYQRRRNARLASRSAALSEKTAAQAAE